MEDATPLQKDEPFLVEVNIWSDLGESQDCAEPSEIVRIFNGSGGDERAKELKIMLIWLIWYLLVFSSSKRLASLRSLTSSIFRIVSSKSSRKVGGREQSDIEPPLVFPPFQQPS